MRLRGSIVAELGCGVVLSALIWSVVGSIASAAVLYSNGFETDTTGWDTFGGDFDATRVPSGTDGITSTSGSFHAVSSETGSAGDWGGYNFGAGTGVPTMFQEYYVSLDIYLDADGGWANNTLFDFESAVSDSNGNFLRDFIFNGGFFNDSIGPGADTNRFVFSASNNSQPGSASARDPDQDPIAISTTGWYTFQQHFYNDGGVLAVDFSISDASANLVHTWTISNPMDLISSVGGNRFGWFDYNEFSPLAFDNTELRTTAPETLPEPMAIAHWASIAATLGGARRLRLLRRRPSRIAARA
jgi:hypothetical protein